MGVPTGLKTIAPPDRTIAREGVDRTVSEAPIPPYL
jgi:hypothetical protein